MVIVQLQKSDNRRPADTMVYHFKYSFCCLHNKTQKMVLHLLIFFFRSWKIPWWLNITLCMFKKGEKRIILQTHQWHAQVNISSYAVFSCDNENRTFILKMPQNTHSNLSVNISKWLLDTADMLQHFTVNRTAVPLKATPFILTWALSCWGADFYK